jgi:hypothetical protein
VRTHVDLPWEEVDLRALDPDACSARVDEWLDADRRRGFDFGRAPLMRLAAMRVTEREYEFIWSSHHILLDGWSHPLLLRELHELYQSLIEHRAARVEPSRPYRHYIEWLQARDMARAGEFWRKALEGFSTPTPLVVASPPEDGAEPEYFEQQVELTSSESREVEGLGRAAEVTLNTVAQAAWGFC